MTKNPNQAQKRTMLFLGINLLTSDQQPDIKIVSSTLGHTSLMHTEKYTRVVDELKKKAVNSLPDYE